MFSRPVQLRPGEVHNHLQRNISLPDDVIGRYASGDKLLALSGYDVDMVRFNSDGEKTQVKLSDHYLHHYVLYLAGNDTMKKLEKTVAEGGTLARMLTGCHAMTRAGLHSFLQQAQARNDSERFAVLGSASGAEYRDNPQRFDAPFRVVLKQPKSFAPLLHIINVNEPSATHDTPYSPLLECPCTPQRVFNVSVGTIDGQLAYPPIHCSPEFEATGNPSCHLSTYKGGWRCCEHGMFLVDTSKVCRDPLCSEKARDEIYMEFTFYYEDAGPEVRNVEPAACCDVTSVTQGNENIEYDVPQCQPGTPPERCLHFAVSVQPVAFFDGNPKSPGHGHKGSDMVDLIFAAPHLHVAGLSIELVDDVTGELLCEAHAAADNRGGVAYGHGSTPGDEDGYLVGLTPCRWGAEKKPPRLRRDHPLRSRAVYNASVGQTGVMSLWLMNVASVKGPDLLV